ncbi:MAG: hypothetical protein KIT83_17700 [Bryobacterales bacterium]|nr:hypothetical protein [Bryobacterales bacterium]
MNQPKLAGVSTVTATTIMPGESSNLARRSQYNPGQDLTRRELGSFIAGAASTVFLMDLPAQTPPSLSIQVRGTYSSPAPFWRTGSRLDLHGVNAVFVHGGSINAELVERASSEGAKVYAEFATLNGKGYVETHPEAWPINERGEQAPAATWFLGACPTEPGFRAYRLQQLGDLLDKFALAGVWMDYFHWHAQFEEPEPILPETCFCPSCLGAFERATGLRPGGASTAEKASWILGRHDSTWRDWRAEVLVEWARLCRGVLRRKRPEALLGVYHCPWTDAEFNGARRRTLGLDFDLLSPEVDVFSPMVYHKRMGRDPHWVRDYVEWISQRLPASVRIWPIVQAHGSPSAVSAAEFEQVMRGGASGRASGLQMFTIGAVAEDPEKMEVLRRLYRGD